MEEFISKIKNKQKSISTIFVGITVVFILLLLLPFFEMNPLSGKWALAFLSIFLSMSSAVIALIFWKRAKKMDKLLSGEKLLVHLELNEEMLQQYASTLKTESQQKNKAIMWVIGILFLVITIPFLFFIERDEIAGFLIIMSSILLIVFLASRFFPFYYYKKNRKGDGQILIGEKYAYVNGYFHNWDFPLSGLSKVKSIRQPFHGIHLSYFYTDRTWKHFHEIKIPLPYNFDSEPIIQQLKRSNKKG